MKGKGIPAQRVLTSLQMVSMALLIGVSLYIYNDWRTHRSSAAPLAPPTKSQASGSGQGSGSGGQSQAPGTHTTEETPLDLGDQGVSGTVEVGPDGTIHQEDGSDKAIPGQPAIKP